MTKITPLNIDDKAKRRRIHLREISGDSDAPMDTVGQDLRAARQRRGDDLATVSRALKIRKDHLEAVEEDRLESLPGKTYAIGFVRSYAAYLGLDSAELVERYKQEISGRHDEHLPTVGPIPDEPRRLPQGWRIIAGIVILAVGYGVYHLLSAGPATQTVPPPPSLGPAKAAVAAPKLAPPPVAQQAAVPSPAIGSSAPPAPPQAAVKSEQTAQNPLSSQMPPPAKPTAAGDAPQAATPSPALAGAGPEAATIYGKNNRNARVVLKAKADTHLLVRSKNGTVYINRNLRAGDSYQVPNTVGLTFSASNAGAVEMDLDGQSMGMAGADQQSAEDISLDPQTITDRAGH